MGRGGREGREERRRGGGECGDGVLTFWIVNGRPTSGEEARSDWTATCAHESHVSLKTSLEQGTLYHGKRSKKVGSSDASSNALQNTDKEQWRNPPQYWEPQDKTLCC